MASTMAQVLPDLDRRRGRRRKRRTGTDPFARRTYPLWFHLPASLLYVVLFGVVKPNPDSERLGTPAAEEARTAPAPAPVTAPVTTAGR